MVSALLVGLGAFIGGVLRYGVSIALASRVPAEGFPWHTFTVNAVGCLAAGIAVGYFAGKADGTQMQLFVVTGVLGGLTTFSAFGLEAVALLRNGSPAMATVYVLATLIAGFVGVAVGLRIT